MSCWMEKWQNRICNQKQNKGHQGCWFFVVIIRLQMKDRIMEATSAGLTAKLEDIKRENTNSCSLQKMWSRLEMLLQLWSLMNAIPLKLRLERCISNFITTTWLNFTAQMKPREYPVYFTAAQFNANDLLDLKYLFVCLNEFWLGERPHKNFWMCEFPLELSTD